MNLKRLISLAALFSLTIGSSLATSDYGPAVNRMITGCQKWYTSGYGHKFCVVHDMEGYYLTGISYLQRCDISSSCHYCVNGVTDYSGDAAPGEISQLVLEANYAWHAVCWNQHSLGTEHEGFASNPAWFTESMYQASALLYRHWCDKFGIPKDRNHIVGHGEWQNSTWASWAAANLGIDPRCGGQQTHTDPGPYWNWSHYMDLIIGGTDNASFVSKTVADGTTYAPGQAFSCSFTMHNNGTTTWIASGGSGYTFNYRSGTQMGAPAATAPGANVGPGGNATFNINFTAPSTPGSYTVTLQMNNANNAFFGQQVSLTINVANPLPTITTQPATLTRNPGETATFTVVASGATGYQWQRNGVNLANGGNISGATSTTLTVANAQVVDAGFYRVIVSNGSGSVTSDQAQLVMATTAAAPGNGAGLRGLYYNNLDFTWLKLSRVDATVNFSWGTGSPDASIGADHFSVRWTGQVQPRYSQTYTFYTTTDDGVRLWVNGLLLINHWNDQSPTEWNGSIALTAGQKYDIQMDYYENGGGATAQLAWSSPSQLKQIIPQTQLYRPPPVLAAIPNQAVAEGTLLQVSANATAWDQVTAVTSMEDFESCADGTPNDQIMFRKPANSGTTSGFLDGSVTNYDIPRASFPAGNSSTRVLHATWSFLTGTVNPWLRLTTANAATEPNPVIDITQWLYFDVYSDKALRVGLGVRETNPTGAIGSNGGASGPIEFVGVPSKNGDSPNPSRTVAAGSWTTLKFNLPGEPVSPFTGNGILESTTGKAVLESLALVPAGGMGVYNVYLDNFLQVRSAALTYSLDPGAPAGASIDPATGLFSWMPPTGQGPATYNVTVRVTDNGSPNLSATQTFTITVNTAPLITAQPQDQSVYPGGNATFSVTATGTAPLTYQWQFNGNPISAATASNYSLTNAQASDSGSYSVVVANAFGSVTSAEATLMVSVSNSPPSIVAQPQSLTRNQGSSATLSVSVAGSVPLYYQWFLNGTPLPGATQNSYADANVQPADAGTYFVVVTNDFGSVTSAEATLTVIVPPSFATQPPSQTVNQGSDVSFTATPNGTPPFAFQWRKDGAAISAATGSAYTRHDVQAADAGSYSVVVTNLAGSATSGNYVLIVNVPPTITTQPQSQIVSAGANVTFTVAASGTPAPAFQWRHNGVNISGATGTSFTTNNVQSAAVGVYSVVVSNLVGTVTSAEALLSLNAVVLFSDDFESGNIDNNWTVLPSPATAMSISSAQNHTSGGASSAYVNNSLNKMYHNLGWELAGHARLTFWAYDNTPGNVNSGQTRWFGEIRGYSGAGYAQGTLQQVFAIGRYGVGFGTGTGTLASEVVNTTNYQGRVVYGANTGWFNLSVQRSVGWHKFEIERAADGTTINFYVDGVLGRSIPAATFATWDSVCIGSVGSGTGTAGDAWFDDLSVLYYDRPTITSQPANQTVVAGADASFSVVATNNPMTYQWRLNGVNLVDGGGISGATSPTLNINNAQGANAGTYTVVVANGAGPAISSAAVLEVAPVIISAPVSCTSIAGTTATFTVTAGGQAPLSYQWLKNGTELLVATTDTLTLTSVSQSDAGTYTVRVSNAVSQTTSAGATLSVIDPPLITIHPASQAVAAGTDVTFTVGATGSPQVSYQWQFNGTDIPGANGASYTRSHVQSADAGAYTVVVSNSGGSQASAPAMLTVNNPPVLTAISSRVVHAGTTIVITNTATDLDAPPQTLSFSLEPGAPANAQITSSSGLFRWVTSGEDVSTTNHITLRVTDDGMPALSDTKSFTITVVAAPTLTATVATNSVILSWDAIAGQTYRLQFKEELGAESWSDLRDVIGTEPTTTVVEPFITDLGTIPQRFYRIQVPND